MYDFIVTRPPAGKSKLHMRREARKSSLCGRPLDGPAEWVDVPWTDVTMPGQLCGQCLDVAERLTDEDHELEDEFGAYYGDAS